MYIYNVEPSEYQPNIALWFFVWLQETFCVFCPSFIYTWSVNYSTSLSAENMQIYLCSFILICIPDVKFFLETWASPTGSMRKYRRQNRRPSTKKKSATGVSLEPQHYLVLHNPKWIWGGVILAIVLVAAMTFWHLIGEPGKSHKVSTSQSARLLSSTTICNIIIISIW